MLCSGRPAVGALGEGNGEVQAILSLIQTGPSPPRPDPYIPSPAATPPPSLSSLSRLTLACVFLSSPRFSRQLLPSLASNILSDCRARGFSTHTGRGLCPALDFRLWQLFRPAGGTSALWFINLSILSEKRPRDTCECTGRLSIQGPSRWA